MNIDFALQEFARSLRSIVDGVPLGVTDDEHVDIVRWRPGLAHVSSCP
jgi:phage terminase Nu1 subunit (DNA packaging protein)